MIARQGIDSHWIEIEKDRNLWNMIRSGLAFQMSALPMKLNLQSHHRSQETG